MSIIHDALKKAEASKLGKKPDEALDATLKPLGGVTKKTKTPASPKAIVVVTVLFLGVVAFLFFGRSFISDRMQDVMGSAPEVTITKMEVPAVPIDPVLEQQKKQELEKSEAEKKQKESTKIFDDFFSYYDKGNYEEALKAIESLISLKPTDPVVYNNYGVVLKRLGRKNEAVAAYGKALALKPDYAQALNNVGAIYISDHNYAKAKEYLQKALDIDANYLDAHLHLAIAFEKNDELEKAKHYYQTYLQQSEGKVEKRIRLQIEQRLAGLKEM